MLDWRLSDEPIADDEDEDMKDPEKRKQVKCTIFLGYTSNLISCGMREIFRFLVKNKMVDCIVTTAGGVEEDFIKCLAPTYLGDFKLPGADLRSRGLNRIGNMLVPNSNYCLFDDWLVGGGILDQMKKEQDEEGVRWTPSKFIHRLGREIDNEESVYYWAYKNDIPVFCPGLTDGSIGDMLFFHTYKNPGLVVDIVGDIRRINDLALNARQSGCIILGGGIPKHHIMNANLMREGADYTVIISTAQEFDGSDAGARPDEAVSWGKIKSTAHPVKIYAEATLVFPILVGMTFARRFWAEKKRAACLTEKRDPADEE
ncbi:Deoxyhypusine synthase [Aduncisulcus paluster]|uniref:Deoxyhypusine synthase n=1 Tax=Aduncisulcus paluster TaxID=2918883 RepID=A0ABQ5K8N7_9EUKA|nr:Deoxyhypusine synthase [Aduncisulcus paluster]